MFRTKKVSSAGGFTIPIAIRRMLDIRKNSAIDITVEGSKMIIERHTVDLQIV
ncbi:AbrB/MazE/SpoVT family DNA-binding domain-containing protein [Alkaliphilus transvaalensis]|nr:AbrB/MazE/SpoVT family DNA-binding domain-containing protein [Alkaliphilus transvaalensis]